MELRVLMIIARLLDPRAWRRRLLQIGGGLVGFVWIWVRAVRAVDGVRRRRDEHQTARETSINARNQSDVRRRIDESIDSLT